MLTTIALLMLSPFGVFQSDQKTDTPVKNENRTGYEIKLVREPNAISVFVGDDQFTRYEHGAYAKPILYPVFGPNQIPMTRSGPMKKVAGEADDHPHHKSIWIGHEINGVDFWTEQGKVMHYSMKVDEKDNSFRARNFWLGKDSEPILRDEVRHKFGANETSRWIDASITYRAAHSDITFADTKEGMFAIRTHPDLRLKPDQKRGVEEVFGSAINSNGTEGTEIWGQSAKWVYYWGKVEGQEVGIAIFDHPTNLRHPTTWHARDYGLIAANPFGLHHFKRVKKGAGEHQLKKGKELTFRYRMLFELGQQTAEGIAKRFDEFAKQ